MKKIIKKKIKKVSKKTVIKKKIKVVKKTAAKKKVIAKKKAKKIVKKIAAKKPVKKLIRTKAVKTKPEKKVGKITHYFNNIKVIVVKLTDVLSVGDTIRVKGGKETDFKQKVVSMEIDGKKIKKAKKGQSIGIKIKDRAREDYLVFKI
jgi:hypothetical protein